MNGHMTMNLELHTNNDSLPVLLSWRRKYLLGGTRCPAFLTIAKLFGCAGGINSPEKNSFDWAQVNWLWSDSKDIPSLGLDGEFEGVIEAKKERYLECWFRDLLVLSFNSRTINFERFEIKNNNSTRACWIWNGNHIGGTRLFGYVFFSYPAHLRRITSSLVL